MIRVLDVIGGILEGKKTLYCFHCGLPLIFFSYQSKVCDYCNLANALYKNLLNKNKYRLYWHRNYKEIEWDKKILQNKEFILRMKSMRNNYGKCNN